MVVQPDFDLYHVNSSKFYVPASEHLEHKTTSQSHRCGASSQIAKRSLAGMTARDGLSGASMDGGTVMVIQYRVVNQGSCW